MRSERNFGARPSPGVFFTLESALSAVEGFPEEAVAVAASGDDDSAGTTAVRILGREGT